MQTLAPHLERTKDLTKSSQTLDMLYLRTLVRVRDYLQRLQSQKEVESYLRATLNQTLARSVHLASSVTQLREQVEMVESVPVIQQRTKYRPCTTILLIPIVLASILVLPDALLAIMA
ncbi:hypothetical protein BASA81_017704 [Batrachochytrium salamandrivorans]|nr:hypothetical protein BASA81_017704 [Batrachochytrium salamandrivorans]